MNLGLGFGSAPFFLEMKMATKTFYATGGLKYGTRRLQAGDPVELTDPLARLYLALGKVTDKKPRTAAAAKAEVAAPRRRRKKK